MRVFSAEARVGLLVIISVILLAALTFQVGNFRVGKKGYEIEAVFSSTGGLEEKAPVRVAGVRVGAVDRIYLERGLAHVVLQLDEETIIREDSEISIASTGILGELHVEITSGTVDAAVIEPGKVVTGEEMVSIDKLIARLTHVAGDIQTMTGTLKDLFGTEEKREVFGAILENFDAMLSNINALVTENREQVDEALVNIAGLAREGRGTIAENRDDLRHTVENLRLFSAELNSKWEMLSSKLAETADNLDGAVVDARRDLGSGLEAMRAAAEKAEKSADLLASILGKIDGGEGTLGRLVNEEKTIDRIDQALEDIGGVAGKINRGEGTLGRLVTDDSLIGSVEGIADSVDVFFKRAEMMKLYLGYRFEYLTDPSDTKNYFTLKLSPNPEKYYLAEVVDDPAGRRSTITTRTIIVTPEGEEEVFVEKEEIIEDELKFSLQFARAFGDLTFRGGLIESRGGVALDYSPFGGVVFSLEGWDFLREEGPHTKFAASYRLHNDFFLSAGVDDWLEEDRLSFFLGAGILFSDDDLKFLLTNFGP